MKPPTALGLALTCGGVELAEVVHLWPRLIPKDRRQLLALGLSMVK
jgi:hypothetical protein